MRKSLLSLALFLLAQVAGSQPVLYNPTIDVQHYEFNVQVSDLNDTLFGRAVIAVNFTQSSPSVWFDLMNVNDTGRGMMVTAVRENGKALRFTHQHNRIEIQLNTPASTGELRRFEIVYKGIPADGLIISRNKYGHRTMFADNWPNRARNWIPCKDHLSDKASVEFLVTAPAHYKVVANGIHIAEKEMAGAMRLTHWKETAPLPTKIMVIGIADFAVDQAGVVNGIPVSSWVFPEDKEKGFYDYGQAVDILPYYIKQVGPYSYQKLANVQSKTIFGGMENAGAIFYYEESITGKRKSEGLLAHEIAHQWFGDGATEADWPHLWLSEGFATQMTHMYLEHRYGRDTLIKSMQADRKEVIAFTKRKKVPVVDTSAGTNIMQLLNTNSYQKGGWVLHMLRHQLGDEVFWKAVRAYYKAFQGKNAFTSDLQKIFETVSGKSLGVFFSQWLYIPENPKLQLSWEYDEATQKTKATLVQESNTVFVFPLELGWKQANGTLTVQKLNITGKQTKISFDLPSKPTGVVLDPNCVLLFEGNVIAK